MSDSVRPHRRQPTRLPCPWDSPGKNTGVGCHFLLQRMKVKSLGRIQLLATPWTAAYQAPPSMGFSRQEYWSGVSLPSPARAFFLFSCLFHFIKFQMYKNYKYKPKNSCTAFVNSPIVSNSLHCFPVLFPHKYFFLRQLRVSSP